MLFIKKQKKVVSPRRSEQFTLLFLGVAFFIYGITSFYFFFCPGVDPLNGRVGAFTSNSSLALLAGFALYGVYLVIMNRSVTGRLFAAFVMCESLVRLSFRFAEVSLHLNRLAGGVEGSIGFIFLVGVLWQVHRGQSIYK